MTTADPAEPAEDRELWRRLSHGDAFALSALFDRYERAVYNHCFRLTASWSTAEDMSSAVFLQVWRGRERIRLHTDSALPLLLTVATNLVRNERRSLTRRLRLVRRLGAPEPVPDVADEVAARMDDEARMAAVLAVAARLPKSEREALELCVWSGVSYAEAAVTLGIAESSVRSRVSRARARLVAVLSMPDTDTGTESLAAPPTAPILPTTPTAPISPASPATITPMEH